jgi:predicted ATPase
LTLDVSRCPSLPQPLTPLLGREREAAEIESWLATARLVTLTGAGGVGKTRLALQVARDVSGEPPGQEIAFPRVAFVDLAPLADPGLVPHVVAAALGVAEQAGRPLPDILVAALRHRQLLLVLDNCEHLVTACASLAEKLLRGCPDLRVLATSRQALGLTGEIAWRVPSLQLTVDRSPLTVGSQEPLQLSTLPAAVRLFLDRAQAVRPGFTFTPENAGAVLQVCRQLDGIPLAIELAAARLRVLTAQQIAARLDDRFRLLAAGSPGLLPRHRTLRAALDWSYDLLSQPERLILRRLSIFVGGWTLEAAEGGVWRRMGKGESGRFELVLPFSHFTILPFLPVWFSTCSARWWKSHWLGWRRLKAKRTTSSAT